MTDSDLPKKLKNDAIVEALMEVRFNTPPVPEIFLGRIADNPSWKGFEARRLPAADIPEPMRRADPNLRYQPVFELRESGGPRFVRLGSQSVTYHRTAPYCGWAEFRPALFDTIAHVFRSADGAEVRRVGLRYINALTQQQHGIRGFRDLNVAVTIGRAALEGRFNLNFVEDTIADARSTVRIASPEFVEGAKLPEGTHVVADVDVSTQSGYRSTSEAEIRSWLERAHDIEKAAFFRLLRPETIEQLREH